MSDDLVKRLRNTPNWMREEYAHYKDGLRVFDRAPFEAADAIEAQAAEITLLRARIAELEAALATARRDAMEEAAQIADSCAADEVKSAKGKYLETKWDFESRADAGEGIAAAIRAAAGGGEVMGWQPIETAPRDGAAVLVYDENLTYEIAYRYRAEWRYGPKGYSCKPTHWMPLPAPPEDREP